MSLIAASVLPLGDPALFEQWGLWYFAVLVVAVAVTAFVPPFPSELMVIASGAMASEGLMGLPLVLATTMLGCLLGDVGVHLLFRRQGLRVLHRWRWGRRLHRMLLRVTLRAGGATTWLGLLLIRAIPGGRTTSMVTAGMLRLSGPRTAALALVGAATWSAWLVGLGYITGTTTGLPPWASTATAAAAGTLVGALAAGVAARRRRARSRRAAGRDAPSSLGASSTDGGS